MDLEKKIDELHKDVIEIKVDVAVLKEKFRSKVVLWGGITGGISGIIIALIGVFFK